MDGAGICPLPESPSAGPPEPSAQYDPPIRVVRRAQGLPPDVQKDEIRKDHEDVARQNGSPREVAQRLSDGLAAKHDPQAAAEYQTRESFWRLAIDLAHSAMSRMAEPKLRSRAQGVIHSPV